jgi:hypothetical protein
MGSKLSYVRGRIEGMKVHERIDGRLRSFIEAQPMFFVATAPNGPGGHVNVSPKGMAGTFLVLDELRVAYLDYHGSGAETMAHLRENGRITVMFCSFQGAPNIVRLHGRGRSVPLDDPEFPGLLGLFPAPPDTHGVRPLMSYEGDRDVLLRWTERRSDADLAAYRRKKNETSIDGLPAFNSAT